MFTCVRAQPRWLLSRAITRIGTDDPRMSQAVVHGDTVYLSGQVPENWKAPVGLLACACACACAKRRRAFNSLTPGALQLAEQVSSTLAKVDAQLAAAGTDKRRLLSVQLWLKSMDDFAAMNAIWVDWLDADAKPARACVEAPMAHPDILFEVMVTAAKSSDGTV